MPPRPFPKQPKKIKPRRDWQATIDRLNASPSGSLELSMGSPGSAQVTRVRLLEQFRHLRATTIGDRLRLELVYP